MNNGFLICASSENYLHQAYLACLSIKAINRNSFVSLLTNAQVTQKYNEIFDNVFILFDKNVNDRYALELRQCVYDVTPYDNTIVIDTDVLVLENLDSCWNYLISNTSILFTTKAFTYRYELIKDNYYRKSFIYNNLPNTYSAFYFFKKNAISNEFFNLLKLVNLNWNKFYNIFCPNYTPKQPSMDISVAISYIILNCNDFNHIMPVNLVHMKTRIQNWENYADQWTNTISFNLTNNGNLYVGNYKQKGIFHYVENSFVTDNIVEIFEKRCNELHSI